MNIRFWHFIHDSAVKITLHPNQVLSHMFGGAHEEGWSSEAVTWTHEIDRVHRECISDGSDCDGRLTRGSETVCSISHLFENYFKEDRVSYPVWEPFDAYQRDYAAEAMNY